MLITLINAAPLGVAVCLAAEQLFFNAQTGGWERPFDPTKHLSLCTRMDTAGNLLGPVQCVDLDDGALGQPESAVLLMTVDGMGQPVAVVDCWPPPPPMPWPATAGTRVGS
jgi:hypothetical protein